MRITVDKTPKGIKIQPQGRMTFDDAMQMLSTAILSTMEAFASQVPLDQQPRVRETIYDEANETFSLILQTFVPDKELRPDLTMEAIQTMEKQIMEKHIAKAKKIGAL